MANAILYVDSAATGTGTGASWANAFTTLAAAIAASGTTGTDFYVSSAHVESATSLTLTFKGTVGAPDRVFSCDETNSPPQTSDLLAGATFSGTAGTCSVSGHAYVYGCSFSASGQLNAGTSTPGDLYLDSCHLNVGTSAALAWGQASATSGCRVTFDNTPIRFNGTGSLIQPRGGLLRWINTPNAIDVSGSLPTTLFATSSSDTAPLVLVDGVDLSALTGKTLINTFTGYATFQFNKCRMPSSYTINNPSHAGGPIIDIINCDNGASGYTQGRWTCQGTLSASNSVFNNASDGDTSISWLIAASATASPQAPFECIDIPQWVPAGTYAASKIAITSTFAALTQNDVWVDVEYLGNASYPLGSRVTTRTAALVPQGSSPAALTTAGATWGTGGQGHNYTLAIPSFTQAMDGYVSFRVKVGNYSNFASFVVYVDPKVTVA